MGKYSLGTVSPKVASTIDKKNLFVDEENLKPIVDVMGDQLNEIKISLLNINNLLNKCVNMNIVSGSRVDVFKGWAKKAKSQALASEKLFASLYNYYDNSVRDYPIKLLDDRISEIEKMIASMSFD